MHTFLTRPLTAVCLFVLAASARGDDPESKRASFPPPPAAVHETAPVPAGVARAADEPAPASRRVAGVGYLSDLARGTVLFDEPGDGAIWAVGDRYKASFDAEGATYVPFFGSRAPRNFPVRFALGEITIGGEPVAFDRDVLPVRDGNRIVFDRGIVDEIYDLSPDSIEQSFVLEEVPCAGELVLSVAVASELERYAAGDALVLRGAHGSVRYGAASSLDERGVASPAPSRWSGAAIEIRVAAERVLAGRRLVVDPVISTMTLDASVEEDVAPDVAYDATTARWLVVYERVFSEADSDVYAKVLSAAGLPLAVAYVDSTSATWKLPQVANNNAADRFLVVAQVGTVGAVIRGRSATTGLVLGPVLTISGAESGTKRDPDVGGDPSTVAPSFFCVVWNRDNDIEARLVTADGSATSGGIIVVENSAGTDDRYPVISKGNGPAPSSLQDWTVVWQRIGGSTSSNIYGARIHWDGSISTPVFPIATSAAYETGPRVSSPTHDAARRVLATYGVAPPGGAVDQIHGRLLQGSTIVDSADLTELSGATTPVLAGATSLDCDGHGFVHAYMREGGLFDVRVATWSVVGDRIAKAEANVALATTADWEGGAEVACAASAGGPSQRAFVVWQRDLNDGDIQGALYEPSPFTVFCEPGLNGVIACPCGNEPSFAVRGCNNSQPTGGGRLVAAGDVAPDTVVLDGSGFVAASLCVFLQGDAVVGGGVAFGDGVRCTGGQLLRIAIKNASGGLCDYPVGAEPAITARAAALGAPIAAGSKRSYSVYYRDPAAFACPSPATFNISNAVQVQW